jgi:hypothetical protein
VILGTLCGNLLQREFLIFLKKRGGWERQEEAGFPITMSKDTFVHLPGVAKVWLQAAHNTIMKKEL